MRFYTDITTNASNYCLLNVNHYDDKRKLQKKAIMIDPGVYELKHAREYSRISFLHRLAELGQDVMSIDYPCDMNPKYSKEFVLKSFENNVRYVDNLNYICTIQHKFKDFDDFVRQYEDLEFVFKRPGKILGLGNLCRINRPDPFVDAVMFYLLMHHPFGSRMHVYGAPLWLIRKWGPALDYYFQLSVDSTKWTRAVNNELKGKYGLNASKAHRDEFFNEYITTIRQAGIEVVK